MGKKLIVVCSLAFACILASHAASNAQSGGQIGAWKAPVASDNDAVIYFSYQTLVDEKREGTDEAAITKHAELLTLLTNYVAKDRVAKAIGDLESIINEMPESDQAGKAALALEALKSESGGEEQVRSRDRKGRGLKVRPLTNPEETTPEGQ